MKVFEVELTITVLVAAESMAAAEITAINERSEIVGFEDDFNASVLREIKSLADIPDHWEADCIPYGGDGDQCLLDILPEEAAPPRDDKTIDMFGGAA